MKSSHPLRSRRLLATGLVVALFAGAGSGAAGAQKVSEPELFGKSAELAARALDVWGELDDRQELARVADIGYRVARHSGYAGMPLTFHLLDMAAPNAFALPGGQIFITRGMLGLDLDDDMLAALLGHEIGHVALDHHVRMRKKSTLTNVLSQALLVGVMVAAANDDSRRNRDPYLRPYDPSGREPTQGQVVQGAAAASLVLGEVLLRSYSREHEDEADEEGQRWAAAAGFDPAGARALMERMSLRLPQSKEYGYLQTHPFLDDRARAARARGEFLKTLEPKDDRDYRVRTQAALLTYAKNEKDLPPEVVELLEDDALVAWPAGPEADAIRLARLEAQRKAELAKPEVARDYGALLEAHRRQRDEVAVVTPESPFLARVEALAAELETARSEAYPQARKVLEEGVYETSFLQAFVSNWPEAEEIPKVQLALGDTYARLQQPTDAVSHYLAAWRSDPESEHGRRAREGLKVLAPSLKELAALQTLADQEDDVELRELAATRLASEAGKFSELRNGAEYLRRFPEGGHAARVTARLETLADKLYNEMVLYRAVGDDAEALERIQTILEHAPLSKAARQLREQAVLES
jgi:Zn-dependent protease with chaperone function/TolA-binding protein